VTYLGIVVFEQFEQDWQNSGKTVILSYDRGHLTKGKSNASFKGDLCISDGRLKSGKQDVANLFSAQVLQTFAEGVDSSIFYLGLVVV